MDDIFFPETLRGLPPKAANYTSRVLTTLFYEDPLYCTPLPHPFQMLATPIHSPVTSKPHSHCSFCHPVSLAEWVIIPYLMCYFT